MGPVSIVTVVRRENHYVARGIGVRRRKQGRAAVEVERESSPADVSSTDITMGYIDVIADAPLEDVDIRFAYCQGVALASAGHHEAAVRVLLPLERVCGRPAKLRRAQADGVAPSAAEAQPPEPPPKRRRRAALQAGGGDGGGDGDANGALGTGTAEAGAQKG